MIPFTIFISYRRQDTAPIALLLKSEIEKRLQFVRVSVDVEEIKAGENFPNRIKSMIDGSHAAIVLIGKNWMSKNELESSQRKDWVVEEISYAKSADFTFSDSNRFGLSERAIIPVFADCENYFENFDLPSNIKFLEEINAISINYANWPRLIGSLLDNLAVRLSLKKRPDADEYPKPDLAKARTQPLLDTELLQTLKYDDFDGWYVDNFGVADVRYLVKTFKFIGFNQATEFIDLVSNHCKILDHHPEWRNVFNHVTVSLTTWDAQRRVTIYDLNLALYMNMAFKSVIKKSR